MTGFKTWFDAEDDGTMIPTHIIDVNVHRDYWESSLNCLLFRIKVKEIHSSVSFRHPAMAKG